MMIKNFGARVVSVWEGLRPMTKKMLVGALAASGANAANPQTQKFSYDVHAEWELSRLLSALDEQAKDAEFRRDAEKLSEIKQLAEACAKVLQTQTASAEVFIQLAERAVQRNDFQTLDRLADILAQRFSAGEVAEIVRQTELAQLRAVAYETLMMMPIAHLLPLLDDTLYFEIARNAIEQQAFEFDNQDAQQILEQLDLDEMQ
ncbi:MAG: hypothetical protein AVDCRST_MAG74-2786 [uncultured Pyrinomonadaceae bacterium]|uniref:Uncharacterized protein n=1 Tax=uncultured Pyrinomonadaceae bacterium TaxID=2283094 RepID=A0A6J4PE89_9BACT|nr:MAG: hypothetical protein AVDCRST_MAG74-2786 [uncultured Pyrinomonadaceae bacterium]